MACRSPDSRPGDISFGHREIAHDTPMSGHLGVNKTCNRIWSHFYWPRLRKHVSEFWKSCCVFQIVGKPNQKIPSVPLQPIPAFEHFSRVLVDFVGPLPQTRSGNNYLLLTIICTFFTVNITRSDKLT